MFQGVVGCESSKMRFLWERWGARESERRTQKYVRVDEAGGEAGCRGEREQEGEVFVGEVEGC